MKKSEQAGVAAYPIKNVKIHKGYSGDFVDYDKNAEKRKIFVEGYEQAKKDLMADAVIIEDELAMCYCNGEPAGLSPYKEWWETPEVQNNFKDGDKVKVIIIKE